METTISIAAPISDGPLPAVAPDPGSQGASGSAPYWVVGLVLFVQAIGYGLAPPALTSLGSTVGNRGADAGWLFGLYAGAGLLLVVPIGYLVRRRSPGFLLRLGLISLVIGTTGAMVAVSNKWCVAAHLGMGMGGGVIWLACLMTRGSLASPATAGQESAAMSGVWLLGFLLGPAIAQLGSWRTSYAVHAVLCLAALLLSATVGRESPGSELRLSMGRLASFARYPEVQISALVTCTLAFYYGCFYSVMPWLLERMGFSAVGVAALFSILALPSILLSRLVGHEADSRGDRGILAIGLPMHGLLAIFFLDFIHEFPLWIGFAALGLTGVILYIPAVAMFRRATHRLDRSSPAALHVLAFSLGFTGGALVGRRFLEAAGEEGLFRMMGFVMILTLVGVNALFTFRRRAPGQAHHDSMFAGGGPGEDRLTLLDG